jgi:hypothetical protein
LMGLFRVNKNYFLKRVVLVLKRRSKTIMVIFTQVRNDGLVDTNLSMLAAASKL